MNVFDYALKVELQGKAAYEKAAAECTDRGLKGILLGMAADEQKHYEVIKQLKEGYDRVEVPASGVLSGARTYFEQAAEKGGLTFSANQGRVWRSLLSAEQEAEKFYREKAAETENKHEREVLLQIAGEERQHARLIQGMVDFVAAPDQWLASGEWDRLDS